MSPEHLWNVWTRMPQSSPIEAVWGLLSSTLVCVVLGAVIAVLVLVTRVRPGRRSADSASRSDRAGLGVIALVVAVVWIGDIVLRGYVFDMSATVSWWRFALAPAVAAAGLAAWVVTRRTTQPRRAVDAASVTRRTWTTFGPRRGIRVLAAVVAVTVGVVVVFGRMSTASDPGLAAHVAWDVPNVPAPPIVMVFPAGPTASRSSRARSRSPPASCSPCIATPCGRTPMERGSTSNVRAVPTSLATSWRWGSEPFWSRSAACFTWRDRLR